MAIDRKAQDDLEATRWRDAHEILALRDLVGMYRRGAVALAADITELRAETERLRGALRDSRVPLDRQLIEVEIELDEHAQDLVSAILLAELADLPAQLMEDLLLVARELTAGSVRHYAGTPDTRAMLRIERSQTSLRIEVQALGAATDIDVLALDTDDAASDGLSIVERLSERWGTERVSSGRTTVWAQLAAAPAA
jgi:hypothetical protein